MGSEMCIRDSRNAVGLRATTQGARVMLKPESLKAKPADNYEDLKRQFFALKRLCESKINQCDIYSRKLAEHDLESVIARNEAIESEREMNAQLTDEIAKANERIVYLESALKGEAA